jgi:hypothetical protein
MTKAKISEYDAVASNNTDVNGVNIAENCPPSGMNNMGREIMAALKRFQTGSDGDGVTVGGNLVVSGSSTLATTAISSADINGGTIDGTAIGGASAAAGAFTTLSATGVTTVQAGTNSAPAITTTGDTNTGIFFPAADTIAFTEGGAEAMRIDASGNLGLGVTPSAWGGGKALQIGGGSIWNSGGAGNVFLGANYYFDGANRRYIANGFATEYLGNGSDGTHIWYNAPSGTAGNTISFTQAMTLDANGNLLVGSTSTIGAVNKEITVSAASGGAGIAIQDVGVSSKFQLIAGAGGVNAFGVYDLSASAYRMTIDSSGNVGVGTTAPSAYAPFTVAKAAFNVNIGQICAASLSASDAGITGMSVWKTDATTSASQIFIKFIINNGSNGSGQINADGANQAAFGTYSDRRLKENIVGLEAQLANICALRPVEFDYIKSEGGGHQVGFVAQEMQEVYPDAVGERQPDGMLTVTGWSKTEARLVKAIQELKAELDTVKAELATLKGN